MINVDFLSDFVCRTSHRYAVSLFSISFDFMSIHLYFASFRVEWICRKAKTKENKRREKKKTEKNEANNTKERTKKKRRKRQQRATVAARPIRCNRRCWLIFIFFFVSFFFFFVSSSHIISLLFSSLQSSLCLRFRHFLHRFRFISSLRILNRFASPLFLCHTQVEKHYTERDDGRRNEQYTFYAWSVWYLICYIELFCFFCSSALFLSLLLFSSLRFAAIVVAVVFTFVLCSSHFRSFGLIIPL